MHGRMPKTCEHCGADFEPKWPNRPGRFCSRDCYNAAGRGLRTAVTKGPRMRRAPDHPLAPPSGVVAVSRLVLFDKIGPGGHPCHWCDAPLTWTAGGGPADPNNLLVDHLDWDRNNNDPDNLVPSCNSCNAHRTRRGDRRRLEQGEQVVLWSGVPTRAIERKCEHCGTTFLIPPSATKKGRGRFCSRSCARSKPKAA